MRKALVFIVAALCCTNVQGAEITVKWNQPTHKGDGSPVVGIVSNIVYWDCGYTAGQTEVFGQNSLTMNLIGNCFFWVDAKDKDGSISTSSAILSKTLLPGGATNVRVTHE